VTEEAGRAEIGRGGACERVIGVRVGKGGCRGAVIVGREDRSAEKIARRCWRKWGVGCGESKGEGMNCRGWLEGRRYDFDLTSEGEFESFGKHFSDLLFGQGPCALHDFLCFSAFLLLSAARSGANGASEDFGSPPTTDGAIAVMETHYGIGVCKGPSMGRLWEARNDVEGGEGEGSGKWRHGG
jgi:hypothetical protein